MRHPDEPANLGVKGYGLEITVASSVAGALANADTLHMSATAVGAIATVYLVGEIVGALVFGRLSDKLGRRNLFMVTLGAGLSVRHPLHRRYRHWRRVRGDQLGDR